MAEQTISEGGGSPIDPPTMIVAAPAPADPAKVEPDKPQDIADPKPDPKPEPEKTSLGDDWRDRLARGDTKRKERLGRFASPEALYDAFEEAQKKISDGLKPKGKPGDKATDEDWAAYRKENGIPETVDDFVKAISLPDKRVIGDDDKPIIEAFAKRAHAKGIAPKDMAEMVDQYYKMEETQIAAQETADGDHRRESEKSLRQEFGKDYEANIAAMRPYFEGTNGELFAKLFGGRMADGTRVGDNPDIIRFFVAKALSENPLAAVMPTGGGSVTSVDTEIKSLEKRMGEDRDAWFKDDAAQKRLQALYDARDRFAAKK